ncbi:hypothetical protein [Symmachiella macrocystis]|nr:hypothetical protein [Symmachiella macrocystis]
MQKEQLASIVGWGFVALSTFLVFFMTMGKYDGGPMFPSLVPVFGIPFAVFYFVSQAGICLWLRSKLGVILMIVACLLGYGIGSVREARWKKSHPPQPALDQVLEEHGIPSSNYDWTRDRMITAASFSGFVLGLICIRKWD